MQTAPVSLRAFGRLIRENRNFRFLWLAQIVSEVGDWLYAVAIYSLILELTGSAQAVALAFVLQVLPQVFVAPAAGVLNDRLSRRRVMIFADWARAVITLMMLFAQSPSALGYLYVLLFAETVFWALFEPGRHALIPAVTRDEKEMLVANALSSTTWSFNLAVGSAIGGLLAALFGRDAVFIINSLSFVVSALILRSIHVHEPHLEHIGSFRARDLFDFSPVVEGIRYVTRDRRLSVTMFVKAGLGLMGANWIILPVLGERIFRVRIEGLDPAAAGMLGMSVLMGARGLGALIGPMVSSRYVKHHESRFGTAIAFSFLACFAGYLALGSAPGLFFACMCIMFAHAGGATAWVYSTTLLQLHTDDRFRGRVFAAEQAFAMFTMSVVTYSGGLLVDAGMSVFTLATITGLLLLLPAGLWSLAQRMWKYTP
jgi:MFS family permease